MRELDASRPLLVEPGAAWAVESGVVDLFLVDASGRREPMFRLQPGERFEGLPAGPLRLLAVGAPAQVAPTAEGAGEAWSHRVQEWLPPESRSGDLVTALQERVARRRGDEAE